MKRVFDMREQDVAATLLPGETLRERLMDVRAKYLKEGRDYVALPQRGVMYSKDGVKALAQALRLDEGNEGGVGASDGSGAAVAMIQAIPDVILKKEVRVVKVFLGNRRYLHAEDDKGTLLTVRVRDNELFLPGMEMEVLKDGAVWDYVGPMPRARGRW